jgi:endonuclease-3
MTEQLALLKKSYPTAKYYLTFSSQLELMVAAILSAQVRDEVVNAATPALFNKYKSAEDYANAKLEDLIGYIRHITFAGNKARNIINACKMLVEKHNSRVPHTLEELTALPGIGRKTANAILINGFGITAGIPCDTHVLRVSYRLGWTKNTNPDKVEQDLTRLLPKKEWKKIPYLLKDHGRSTCKPVPICSRCFLSELCPKQGVTKRV